MFAQKLQNPFLKPTPYFSPNSYAASAYAPPLPPTSKYSVYPSYEPQQNGRYDSYSNSNDRAPERNPSSKYNTSVDIDDILRNNPFNRPTNGIFSASSANSYSPAKYDSNKSYQNSHQNSYERKEGNDSYSHTRRNYAVNDGIANQYSQNRHTPKKYDNYLSTSSADSAVTYINKIYELDEDRSQGFAALSNPFQRRNLIEEKRHEREPKPANSYDSAAMKYIAEQRQYEKPAYMENNYFVPSSEQYPTYESKKSKQQIENAKDYSELQYRREEYGSKKDLNQQNSYRHNVNSKLDSYNYSREDQYEKAQINLGSKHHIESKYDIKYEDNENNQKFNKYEEMGKESYGSKYNRQRQEHQYAQEYDQRSKELENSGSKFDFEESKQEERYGASKLKDEYQQDYKFSFKGEFNDYLKKDQKQSKTSQEKVNFPESEESYQSSKYKGKEYPGQFQTLGGVPSSKYQDPYRKPNELQSKKLISSQVEEYEAHQENRRQKRQLERPIEQHENLKGKTFAPYEQEQDEEYSYQTKSKKGPRSRFEGELPSHHPLQRDCIFSRLSQVIYMI